MNRNKLIGKDSQNMKQQLIAQYKSIIMAVRIVVVIVVVLIIQITNSSILMRLHPIVAKKVEGNIKCTSQYSSVQSGWPALQIKSIYKCKKDQGLQTWTDSAPGLSQWIILSHFFFFFFYNLQAVFRKLFFTHLSTVNSKLVLLCCIFYRHLIRFNLATYTNMSFFTLLCHLQKVVIGQYL